MSSDFPDLSARADALLLRIRHRRAMGSGVRRAGRRAVAADRLCRGGRTVWRSGRVGRVGLGGRSAETETDEVAEVGVDRGVQGADHPVEFLGGTSGVGKLTA